MEADEIGKRSRLGASYQVMSKYNANKTALGAKPLCYATRDDALECGDLNLALRRAMIERGICPDCGGDWHLCEGIIANGELGCTALAIEKAEIL